MWGARKPHSQMYNSDTILMLSVQLKSKSYDKNLLLAPFVFIPLAVYSRCNHPLIIDGFLYV